MLVSKRPEHNYVTVLESACAAGGVQERDKPGATSAPTNQSLPNSQRFLFGHGEMYVGGSCHYANHSQAAEISNHVWYLL